MIRNLGWLTTLGLATTFLSLPTHSLAAPSVHTRDPHLTGWIDKDSGHIHASVIVGDGSMKVGCQDRESVLFNGTTPGPEMRFKQGEHVFITVHNQAPEETTVHWHGLSQQLSPFSDGSPQSQYPIPSHGSFVYEFKADRPGTYFYHTHLGLSSGSAYGAFIIEDSKRKPYDYDEDVSILFADGYNTTDATIQFGLLNSTFTWPGEPQQLLINGVSLTKPCPAKTQVSSVNATGDPPTILTLKPEKSYRLRFIGATALSYISFAIEEHNLTLIEADGRYLKPLEVSHVELAAGQRYSAILQSKQKSTVAKNKSYWATLATRWRPSKTNGTAVVRYGSDITGLPSGEPLTLPNETYGYIRDQLQPLNSVAPPPASRLIHIDGQQKVNSEGTRWYVSEQIFNETEPSPSIGDEPLLIDLYKKPTSQRFPPNFHPSADGANAFEQAWGAYPIRANETVDVVITNRASSSNTSEAHPWHVHGSGCWSMAYGPGEFSASDYQAALDAQLAAGRIPILRDTDVAYPNPGASYQAATSTEFNPGDAQGWTVFRCPSTNPGVMMLHCHLTYHMLMGMQTTLAIAVDQLPELPQSLRDGYLSPNGTAYGIPGKKAAKLPYFKDV